jgi:hypothetical protein
MLLLLNLVLKKENVMGGFDLFVSGRGDVAGCCEHGNEHPDFR